MLNILFIYFNHYHDSKTLGFIYFVGLKMHRKPLVYAAQCRVPDWTPQNKFDSNRVTPPTEDMGLRAKTTLDNGRTTKSIKNETHPHIDTPIETERVFLWIYGCGLTRMVLVDHGLVLWLWIIDRWCGSMLVM